MRVVLGMSVVFAIVAGCSTSKPPFFQDVRMHIPAPPEQYGRIFVLREQSSGYTYFGAKSDAKILVDGEVVGKLPPMSILYVDVAMGSHEVKCSAAMKSDVVQTTVGAGETCYIQVFVKEVVGLVGLWKNKVDVNVLDSRAPQPWGVLYYVGPKVDVPESPE